MGRTNARRAALNKSRFAAWLAFSLTACGSAIEIGEKLDTHRTSSGGASSLPPSGMPDAANGAAAGQAGDTSPAPVDEAGASDPGLVWSTGFESNDLSDWTADGAAIGGTRDSAASSEVSSEQAHTGNAALKVSFDTADGQDHLAELYRRIEPRPAYYGAWFYITEQHTPAVYWSLFYFFAEAKAGDPSTRHALWDLNLNASAVYFYDESLKHFVDSTPNHPYPIGRWFHLEALLEQPSPTSAHVSVWLDGQPIIDVTGLTVAASDTLYWAIGSETDRLTPTNCTMYLDDATVSLRRVGP